MNFSKYKLKKIIKLMLMDNVKRVFILLGHLKDNYKWFLITYPIVSFYYFKYNEYFVCYFEFLLYNIV